MSEEATHSPYRNIRHIQEANHKPYRNVWHRDATHNPFRNIWHRDEATYNPYRNVWQREETTHNPYQNVRHSKEATHNPYRNVRHIEEATHNPCRITEHFVHYKTRYMKHESELHTATSINLMLCYRSMVERSDRDMFGEKKIYIYIYILLWSQCVTEKQATCSKARWGKQHRNAWGIKQVQSI